jgi:hypothetical protein
MRLRASVLGVAMLGIVVMAAPAPAEPGFVGPFRLLGQTGGVHSPVMRANSAGDAVVAWIDDQGQLTATARNGQTHRWLRREPLTLGVPVGSVDVGIDETGHTIVAWTESVGSTSLVLEADGTTAGLGRPRVVFSDFSVTCHCYFRVQTFPDVHVAIGVHGAAVITSGSFASYRSSPAEPWSAADRIGERASVAVGPNGDAVAAWRTFYADQPSHFTVAVHRTSGWHAQTVDTSHAGVVQGLGLDAAGNAVVVWLRSGSKTRFSTGLGLYSNNSPAGSTTFLPTQRLTDPHEPRGSLTAYSFNEGTLAIDLDGTERMVYVGSAPDPAHAHAWVEGIVEQVHPAGAGSWSAPQRILAPVGIPYFASTAVGRLLLVMGPIQPRETSPFTAAFGPADGQLTQVRQPLAQVVALGPLSPNLRALELGFANGQPAEARFRP